jgi:hypothetical protein
VILPVYLPAAIFLLESPGRRRRFIAAFIALGTVVSTLLLAAMLRGPATARLGESTSYTALTFAPVASSLRHT